MISCDGEAGVSGAGGASGGSLMLVTNSFSGSGTLQANGGDGDTISGGGGGGRVSITYTTSEFTGKHLAYGGRATNGDGGAGTVYVEGAGKKMLYIDNKTPSSNIKSKISNMDMTSITGDESSRTWVPFDTASITLDELYILNGAHMALEPSATTTTHSLTVQNVYGEDFINNPENKGVIHVGHHQSLAISQSNLYLPFNANVYNEGVLQLPSTVKMYKGDFFFEGILSGVSTWDMINSNVELKGTSKTQNTLTPASFTITTLNILAGSTLTMRDNNTNYKLDLNSLFIGATGTILGRKLEIEASASFVTEDGANIDLDGQGSSVSGSVSNTLGTSHGGQGGKGTSDTINDPTNDDMRNPSMPGTGNTRAAGGGVIKITTATFTNDGVISANGQDANTTGYGGAAGGSIEISCTSMQNGGRSATHCYEVSSEPMVDSPAVDRLVEEVVVLLL
ncbi:uncharacterized protein LOC117331104 [Pecten maximus]|uniref:uncharacterized protein LOC117331104 n=1 Tax=Pecten maximus TaxID=6579 RepID=UPI0014582531|nr:uncharacterized protein LOC117331104 [Pecten maximus]